MDLAKGMFFMSDCYDYGPTLLVWNEAAYGEVDLTVAGAIINDPYLIPSSIYRYVRVGDGGDDWLVPYIKDKWPDVISVHPLEEGISHLHYELKEPFFVEVDFSAIKGKVGTLVFEEGR